MLGAKQAVIATPVGGVNSSATMPPRMRAYVVISPPHTDLAGAPVSAGHRGGAVRRASTRTSRQSRTRAAVAVPPASTVEAGTSKPLPRAIGVGIAVRSIAAEEILIPPEPTPPAPPAHTEAVAT